MDRPNHRLRTCFLAGPTLALTILAGSGCHPKVISGGALDRQAIVKAGEKASEARALPFVRKVSVHLVPASDLGGLASEEGGEERLSGRSDRQTKLFALLGLVPWGSDLSSATESLLGSQPAGYYLSHTDRLTIVARDVVHSEVIEALGAILGRDLTFGEVVSHELVHALQDQHFRLQAPRQVQDNQDAALAYTALVEGDAFLASFGTGMGALLFDEQGFVDFIRRHAPDMGALPSYFQERFKFPYLDGTAFALALKKAGGWETVNRAYQRPPRSTAEVLHPEAYLAGGPAPLLPDLSGLDATLPGFERILEDTVGEFALRILVGGKNAPFLRTPSWSGDRAAVFEKKVGGGLLLVWVSDWNDPAAAASFFGLMEAHLETVNGPADEDSMAQARWTSGERLLHLQLSDRRVVFVNAPPTVDVWDALQAAWLSDGRPFEQQAVAPPPPQPALATADAFDVDTRTVINQPRGPALRLGTDSASLTLGALLQVRGQSGSEGTEKGGATIQRLRLSADGVLTEMLDLGIHLQLELTQLDPLIQEAYLSFAPVSPSLANVGHLLVGRFKVPFSSSILLPEESWPLNHRPLAVELLSPERRVGMGYDLDLGSYQVPVRMRLGAFDGTPAGSGKGPLLAARLDFDPSLWLAGVLRLKLGAAFFFDRNRLADSGSEENDWKGLAFDARIEVATVFVEGEVLIVDKIGGAAFGSTGWSVTSGWFVLPDFLQLVGRYEQLHDPGTQSIQQVSGGANLLYFGDRFRMSYNFRIRMPEGSANQVIHLVLFQVRI